MKKEKNQTTQAVYPFESMGNPLGLILMSALLLAACVFLGFAISQKNITGIVMMALALAVSSVAFLFSLVDYRVRRQ
jgi:hypothetical protein